MGFYINPENESKEEFLRKNGKLISQDEFETHLFTEEDTEIPVCLVDNGFFTAAGIAYSPRELQAFTRPSDDRPKRFYLCDISKVLEVSDLPENYKEFAQSHW